MIELKKIMGFTAVARRIFWLLVLLSLPTTMMTAQTGASINGQALLATGKPAAFAAVRVCAYTGGGIPCSPLSSLFSDAALTQPVSNPYTSDQSGNFSVFAAPGYYILQLTIAGSGVYSYLISPSAPGGGSGGGVLSINGTPGAFTFNGPGVSCTGTTCTFSGGAGISLTTTGTTGASTLTGSVLNIPQYQGQITLTTTGSSGAATLIGNTLNVPQYAGTTYSAGTGLTLTGSVFSVNTSQDITTLSNLTSNGFVKTSGGAGALSIDTTVYAPLTSPTFLTGITTPAITLSTATGSTQCLQVNTSGVVAPTGAPCGSGGGGITALTGDVTASGSGSVIATVKGINGTLLSGLATGILKNTTTTGVPSIATDGTDYLSPTTGLSSLTGDVTTSAHGAAATTLATVNSNVGSFGSSTSIPSFTVNAKGLITAASGNVVIAPAGTLSGTTLNSTVVSSSLTSLGTITSLLASNITDSALTSGHCVQASTSGLLATISVACGTGNGTVTSFSAGTLSPLFTTSVATATTTPALSFTASTAAQNAVLAGPASGGTGAYSFRALVAADIPAVPPSGAAGGALSGSYPNPTIAGLGSTAKVFTYTDGAGNLQTSVNSYVDSDGFLNLNYPGINIVTNSVGSGGQLPGLYYLNTACPGSPAEVGADSEYDTGNFENLLAVGHQNECSSGGTASAADISYITVTGLNHKAPGTSVYSVTNSQLTSNVVTLTASNSLSAGEFVLVFNLTSGTLGPLLNNQIFTVLTASSTQFTFAFVNANVGSAAESGNASQQLDNQLDIANQTGGIINIGGTIGTPLMSFRSGLSPNGIFLPLLSGCLSADGTTHLVSGSGSACGSGGGITFPQTVGGTVNSGGLVYANSGTQISVSAAGTAGQVVLWGGAGTQPGAQAIGTSGATLPLLNAANTWSGAQTHSAPIFSTLSPGASTAAFLFQVAPFSGGSGTTTFPLILASPGVGPTSWSTGGTYFGVSSQSGFAGNFLDFHVNGGASVAKVDSAGASTNSNVTDSALTAGQQVVAGASGLLSNGGTAILACSDTSASGTAQTCTTSPSFTPAANSCVTYTTTTANSGAGLTLNVNGLGAKSVAKWLGTTTLAAGDVAANSPQNACYNGTVWNLSTIGNAPSGGGTPAYPQTVTGCVSGGILYGSLSTEVTCAPLITTNEVVLSGGAATAPFGSANLAWDATNGRLLIGAPTSTAAITLLAGTTAPFGINFGDTSANLYRSAANTLKIDGSLGIAGNLTMTNSGNITNAAVISSRIYNTTTNCTSTASPAVCTVATSGIVQVAAAATTLQVNTTSVTNNSRIWFTYSVVGITAPTNVTALVEPYVSAISSGASFTITLPVAPLTNPINVMYGFYN